MDLVGVFVIAHAGEEFLIGAAVALALIVALAAGRPGDRNEDDDPPPPT
ncbi:MAG: hypothetical protein M3345_07315 [Actinomycetota bacterium]|nr:hypothetical protein [Actinomycetota bacterium]